MLSHTVSSTNWHALHFNGVEVGEVGINAALCGTWGVPVKLVTGDDVVCAEASALLGPDVHTLAVKTGARPLQRPPPLPRPRPRAARGAPRAPPCSASAPVYDPGAPCTITVELNTSDQADPYRHRAGVTVTGPRTIEATADTLVGRLARDLPDTR